MHLKSISAVIFVGLLYLQISYADIQVVNSVSRVAPSLLSNYLGDGKNPKLQLILSTNAPNWQSFTIDYQQNGSVPYPTDPLLDNWSTWNVYDTNNPRNYYGTITLTSDGVNVAWSNYTAPQPATGFYLSGVNFCHPYSTNPKCPATDPNYSLTVDQVFSPVQPSSPFPDAPIAAPPKNFSLHTQSNTIVDNVGNIIKIKGVVRPSLEWNKQGQYLSETDIKNMKKFGANAIRLDLNADYWNNSESETIIGSYRQIINAIVYYATQNNMLVILDYHWSNDSVKQENMAPANNTTINFWKTLASEYKNFGNVLFELYNEPHDISYDVWLHGNSQYEGMQQMYDIVRNQIGVSNLIIVGGLNWGFDLSFLGLNKNYCNNNQENCFVKENDGSLAKNVLYNSHPYNKTDSFFATDNLAGVKGLYPIIYTEFGDNQPIDYSNGVWETVYKNILSEINFDNINYTAFAWWVEKDNPAFPTLIDSDWQNFTCTNGGCNVGEDLISKPGTTFNFN